MHTLLHLGQERYTEALEVVREEENTRSMMKRETDLVTEMNRLKTEIAHENRVNMEIVSWLKDRHTYLTNLHNFWTKKLNEDVPAKEAELQKLKDSRNRDRKALQDARERIDVANAFISKYFFPYCLVVTFPESAIILLFHRKNQRANAKGSCCQRTQGFKNKVCHQNTILVENDHGTKRSWTLQEKEETS